MRLALEKRSIAADEAAVVAEFIAFLKAASARRPRAGHGPVRRFNQARATGCVDAEFTVLDGLPADARVGLFAHAAHLPARDPFANATSQLDRERDIRGMSIRVHRRAGRQPDAGRDRAGLRAEQPSGDDGAGTAASSWSCCRPTKPAVCGACALLR